MMRSLLLVAVGLGCAAPAAHGAVAGPVRAGTGMGPGAVTAVSVLPGPGRAQVVIDVSGTVSVQDFTLKNPDRLVVDLTGAALKAPIVEYDGANRGGITNIRYAQFRPDVVRVVLQLDGLKDYQVDYADGAVTVSLGTDQRFAAWTSGDGSWARQVAQAAAAASPEPAAEKPAAYASYEAGQQLPQSQQPAITATWDNASISDVIAGFAAFSGQTIIVGRGVTGTVTATVKNQPWDVAFDEVLRAQGLSARTDYPGIIRVDDQATLAKMDSVEPLKTNIYRINYARATALVPALDGIKTSRGKIVADTATNSLIVTDLESRMSNYDDFLKALDVPTPQVSIQTKLVFVDRTDLENLGLQYDLGSPTQFFNNLVQRGNPASSQPVDTNGDGIPDAVQPTQFYSPSDPPVIDLGGNSLSAVANADQSVPGAALRLIFSTAIGNFNLTSFLQALESVQLADLEAEPLVSTADNTEANVLVGERTPIRVIDVNAQGGGTTNVPRATTQIVPTGITLTVTPHVTNNRQVQMQLHAENSSVATAPGDIGITFKTQQADTRLMVADGETAVIGGLTVTQITVAKTGIPFLVDLPVLGRIFGFTSRQEERRDLLILVTPHIVDQIPAASSPSDRP
jgi:type IV pilus assembly protein PilQ